MTTDAPLMERLRSADPLVKEAAWAELAHRAYLDDIQRSVERPPYLVAELLAKLKAAGERLKAARAALAARDGT